MSESRTDRVDARGAAWPLEALGLAFRSPKSNRDRLVRAGVLGLGRSGLGAAGLLLDRGARVALFDLQRPSGAEKALRELETRGASLQIGPHDPAHLDDLDLLVVSPGVRADAPFLREASKRGLPVIAELELAFLCARGPVVGVTGTNGKSTTTAWAGHMLREGGVHGEVVGNIGRAFSEVVRESPDAAFACEVSSFQLEQVKTFRPRVAILLNFTPDHLDRHGSLEAYFEAKLKIFSRQEGDDLALVGSDDGLARRVRPYVRGRFGRIRPEDRGEEGSFVRDGRLRVRYGDMEVSLTEPASLSLPGPHNLENALAAAAAAIAIGVDPDAVGRSLRTFPGLPHRLEPVGAIGGVRFVNDSKATNTDSLAVALRAFPGKVTLIAGGRGKGQDFTPLAPLVRERVGLLILMGEAAPELERAWQGVPALHVQGLEEAVRTAAEGTPSGGVALLSPGCASFDMFSSYEDRGDRFRTTVRKLGGSRR